ncbi:MAG: VWA domain-containing protein [Dehalococcoidia bacterium]
MSFDSPAFLLALLLIPLAVGAYVWAQLRKSSYAVRFTNLDLLASVVEKTPDWKRHVPPALFLAALAALVFAMARPQTILQVPKEEATVVLVTDVSGSMNATDVEPSRLEAAKESAEKLIDKLPKGFQMSLVAFASGVSTVVPPTDDKELMLAGVQSLRSVGGTAMGDALMQAIDIARPPQLADAPPATNPQGTPVPTPSPVPIRPEDLKPAIIILLSDGKNSTGRADPIEAATLAAEKKIPVFTIALGTPDGVVDVPDQFGNLRRIAVPPDEVTLEQIAKITDGKFYAAESATDLGDVYENLGSKIGFRDEESEITWWFAAAAAALMLAAGGLSLWWFNRFP